MAAKRVLMLVAVIAAAGLALGQDDVLTAVQVDTPPVLDGSGADPAWAAAKAHEIGYLKLKLKAVYTGNDIYILATWPDKTFSIVRGGSWLWEGKTWKSTKSTKAKMSEDRIAFLWSMDTPGFGDSGCMVKCHPGAKPPVAYLDVGKADMWHMKAARSLPAGKASQEGKVIVGDDGQPTSGTFRLVGYSDDKWVGQLTDKSAKAGGRYGDDGKSTYAANAGKDTTVPKYMEKSPSDYIDAMVLLQSEIDSGEAVKVEELGPVEIGMCWAKYKAVGARVPERILRKPEGSRADIRQAGEWKDGVWVVEFQRSLKTGNPDDVAFDDLKKSYLFGIALMDNAGGEDHEISDTVSLVFQPAK